MTIHTKVDQFEQGFIITFYLVRILIHIAISNLRSHARIYEHKSHPSTLPYSSSEEQMQFA